MPWQSLHPADNNEVDVTREGLQNALNMLVGSLTNFITITAPTLMPPLLPGQISALNINLARIQTINTSVGNLQTDPASYTRAMVDQILGEITVTLRGLDDIRDHLTPAVTNSFNTELNANMVALGNARNAFENRAIRNWASQATHNIIGRPTAAVVGHVWDRNRGKYLALAGVGGLLMTGLPQKVATGLSQVQGIPSSKAGKGAPAHLASDGRNKEPSLQEIFNNLSIGGGIESPEKQKFDNLFEAIQDSETSWAGEVVADRKQRTRHLQKEVSYKGVPHTVDIWLTVDREGDDNYITIAQKSFINDPKSPSHGDKTFERTKRFKRNEDGGSLYLSIDDGQFHLSDIEEMGTELGKTSKFFGK